MDNFLVIQLARFGDILQSKRLVLSLTAQGKVWICVDQSLEGLASLVYPQCHIIGLPAHGSHPGQVLSLGASMLAALKQQNFSQVYNLNYSGLNRAVAAMFEPDIVRGHRMRQGRAERQPWLDLGFRWTQRRRFAPINLVDMWAMLAPVPLAPQAVNPQACPGGKGLGVVMAGQNPRRSLEPENLALAVRAAYERTGGGIYLLGGEKDRSAARKLLAHLGNLAGKAENMAGRTPFPALAKALQGLDLLLCPDTGTAHLAAHLGVPVAGLFCSSAWAWETGPYGAGHTVWQNSLACAPCLEAAPCALGDAPCRKLYAQGAFLQTLAGKTSRKMPENLRALCSGFDALGLIWQNDEPEPEAGERIAQRALLAEWLGQGTALPQADAGSLFREKDWILPTGERHDSKF